MRTIEIIMIVLAALTAASHLLFDDREERILLPVVNMLLLVVHVSIEGYRWQMVPVYGVIVAQLIAQSLPLMLNWQPPTIGAIISLVVVGIGAALSTLLPVFDLPAPDGPHPVGTVTTTWVDESREEIYGDDPGGPRTLVVQIWYPAETVEGYAKEEWLREPRMTGQAMAQWVGLPGFITGHFNLVETYSYREAPLLETDRPLPVILSLHGWAGFREINQDQIEELASHGYVVVAANHTHAALLTDFSERTVPLDTSTIPNADEVGEDAYLEGVNTLVKTFAADSRFMLDQLEGLNADDPDNRFTGRLALEAVGYFGHSTGGGGAIEACADETRCAAVFGQDAWVIPVSEAVIDAPGPQPLFMLNSETWATGENYARQQSLIANSPDPLGLALIEGTGHYDFTVVPLLSPIAPTLGLKGPLEGSRVAAINQDYLLAFFNTTLRNDPSDLMQGSAPAYPEVVFVE